MCSAFYNPWEMFQTLPPDRFVMGRHDLPGSVWRCYYFTIWVPVCWFKHLSPEGFRLRTGLFSCKNSFSFTYLENQYSAIKTDGLIWHLCIAIETGTGVWCPNVWTAPVPPGTVDLFLPRLRKAMLWTVFDDLIKDISEMPWIPWKRTSS